jgi:hypothetical protein
MESDSLNASQAAEKIGVSYPSFLGVLKKGSKPNKATAGKYVSFLGITEEAFNEAIGKEPPTVNADGTVTPAKRRGRPPGSKNATGAKPGRKRIVSDAMPAGQMALALRVLSDGLAVKVATASPEARAMVAKLLA